MAPDNQLPSLRRTRQAAQEAVNDLGEKIAVYSATVDAYDRANRDRLEAAAAAAADAVTGDRSEQIAAKETAAAAEQARQDAEDFVPDNVSFGWALGSPDSDYPEVPVGAFRVGETTKSRVTAVVPLFDTCSAPSTATSLLIPYEAGAEEFGDQILVNAAARLLATSPPGAVRFLLCDPDGLGTALSGLMPLAEYDRDMIGGKVWTNPDEVRKALDKTATEAARVVTEELGGRYGSLAEANAASSVPVAYRVVLVRNFHRLDNRSLNALEALVSRGGPAGHHVIATVAAGQNSKADRLLDGVATLEVGSGVGMWTPHHGATAIPLRLAPAPDKDTLLVLCREVAQAHHDGVANQVIAQHDPDDAWTRTSQTGVAATVGTSGDTDAVFELTGETPVNAVVLGSTGSGKSTFLHALVCGLARSYSPDELELMLVDLKQGAEFKLYGTAPVLPHASIVAAAKDPEFAMAVLRSLKQTIEERSDIMTAVGATNVAQYRERTGKPMRRIVALFDEFTNIFEGPQHAEAARLLSQVSKQGRAWGIHLVLATQSLGSTAEHFPKDVRKQFQLRIAMDDVSADELIDGKHPSVTGRGMGLLNDETGAPQATRTFRGAFLDLPEREGLVDRLAKRAADHSVGRDTLMFAGDVLIRPDDLPEPGAEPGSGQSNVWLGRAVALHGWTAASLWPTTGGSMLIVGRAANSPDSCAPTGLSLSAVRAYAAHPDRPTVTVVNQTGRATRQAVAAYLQPFGSRIDVPVTSSAALAAVEEHLAEAERRIAEGDTQSPMRHLVLMGLDRVPELFDTLDSRRDDDLGPRLLSAARNGPEVGCHLTVWLGDDTVGSTTVKSLRRAFAVRVACPMDSDAAYRFTGIAADIPRNRAVLTDDDARVVERFVPVLPLADAGAGQ